MSKWKESNKLCNSLYLFSKISFIYYVCGCFAQVYVCVISCTQCLTRPEEDIKFPGTGIIDGYELPHGCWELNSRTSGRTVSEQSVVLTSEQPSSFYLFIDVCVCMCAL